MNRIILIGNGFDLAHGLPTRYEDFINWYWEQRLLRFAMNNRRKDEDILCTFEISPAVRHGTWSDVFDQWRFKYKGEQGSRFMKEAVIGDNEGQFKIIYSDFFGNICKSIETKGWVDIENEYYRLLVACASESEEATAKAQVLNERFKYVRELLMKYLSGLNVDEFQMIKEVKTIMYGPFMLQDIAVSKREKFAEYFRKWLEVKEPDLGYLYLKYDIPWLYEMTDLKKFKDKYLSKANDMESTLQALVSYESEFEGLGVRPERILFLNFNYTKLVELYMSEFSEFRINYIHGKIQDDNVIFGYGDELDEWYSKILKLNENEYLRNMKSIRYLESNNYRNMLSFMESAPYQIYIMGHSCGISDRTLLNTLFEHRNCVSIKPFYYSQAEEVDNYLDIVQNISRNFTDMKLMRDRVVNKTFCKPMPQSKKK